MPEGKFARELTDWHIFFMRIFKFTLLSVIFLNLLALLSLGIFMYAASTPHDAASSRTKLVVIEEGAGLRQISDQLRADGLIRDARVFMVYALFEGRAGSMQAGIYELSPSLAPKEIVRIISEGNITGYKKATIPEGYTSAQIADLLVKMGILDNTKDFLNLVNVSSDTASGMYSYEYLAAVNTDSLEGFLFPDTYEFSLDMKARDIIGRFLANFDKKASRLFLEKGAGQAQTYTPYEILILASLLEKEVQTAEDMRLVAGILYNRLSIEMPLQVDATLAYITGKKTGEITNADKEIDSLFNTYKYRGLPPEPIANPGLRAITAALNPAPTDYTYYLSAPDGTTYFAKTLEEHNINKQRYLR